MAHGPALGLRRRGSAGFRSSTTTAGTAPSTLARLHSQSQVGRRLRGLMRLWEFDQLGRIASAQFNINREGLQSVSAMLGFLWINEEQLGFGPTILKAQGRGYIEIERNGQLDRLVIDEVMKRAPCIAGRATTCWKAHYEGDDLQTPLVVKDSWQFPERKEEGELLCGATNKGVVNVA